MEKGYEILSNNELECFICRDVGLMGEDPLKTFCDCKNLVAHHSCLLTWIRKGLGQEDRLRCRICNAEYQQQRYAPWRTMASQWQTWSILAIAVLLQALVPYVVYRMMTAFKNPPPHTLFKTAAICFGLLSEVLLINCLATCEWPCSSDGEALDCCGACAVTSATDSKRQSKAPLPCSLADLSRKSTAT